MFYSFYVSFASQLRFTCCNKDCKIVVCYIQKIFVTGYTLLRGFLSGFIYCNESLHCFSQCNVLLDVPRVRRWLLLGKVVVFPAVLSIYFNVQYQTQNRKEEKTTLLYLFSACFTVEAQHYLSLFNDYKVSLYLKE